MTAPDLGPELKQFVEDVDVLVHTIDDEGTVTRCVAGRLATLLAGDFTLPAVLTRPRDDRVAIYPVYVAADDSFSVASAVWAVGQTAPPHGHETWGVIGLYAGEEHEVRYHRPTGDGTPLRVLGDHHNRAGEVTVCCTSDNDIHEVSCVGDTPVVGIQVYGANIGTLQRRKYDPSTGTADWYVSAWDTPTD